MIKWNLMYKTKQLDDTAYLLELKSYYLINGRGDGLRCRYGYLNSQKHKLIPEQEDGSVPEQYND